MVSFFKLNATLLLFIGTVSAYSIHGGSKLVGRDTDPNSITVNGVPNSVSCGTAGAREFKAADITAAVQNAIARDIDGRRVPNPKNPNNNNPYPHQFRSVGQLQLNQDCTNAQGRGELKEWPILAGALFDETSKDVGNDRVFYMQVAGSKVSTLCVLGTHDGAVGKKFVNCAQT